MTDEWEERASRMVEAAGPMPPDVARAMRAVPRHRFVPASLQHLAYEDEPLPLPYGEATISAPHMVACQLEWAGLRPGQSVLEVGSGSGYLLALIADLVGPGGHVTGVEVDPGLVRLSSAALASLGYRDVTVRQGDGRAGDPLGTPFDCILVSAATSEIEPQWKTQLSPGGTLVAPLGSRFEQLLVRWRNTGGDGLREEGPACRFVALKSSPVRVL